MVEYNVKISSMGSRRMLEKPLIIAGRADVK
jgi:hypothetical protein